MLAKWEATALDTWALELTSLVAWVLAFAHTSELLASTEACSDTILLKSELAKPPFPFAVRRPPLKGRLVYLGGTLL